MSDTGYSLTWPAYSRTLGVIAAIGFFASLGVFAYSYTGDSISRQFPPVWLLHIGIFVVWGPAVFFVHRVVKGGLVLDLLASFPKLLYAAAVALMLAVPVFGSGTVSSLDGAPEEHLMGYVLNDHGHMRDITREQYLQAKALWDRGFSVMWLEFYGLSALFWLGHREKRAVTAPPEPVPAPPR